jgi:pyruvate carboxylase subunit B
MTPNALQITDLTFRDGHQSLFATRVRTDDLAAIAPDMNEAGFWSMEVWGGATFDVMTRFLNEDPWERIRVLKRLMPKVRLQMLLRGQNLVGYRNHADDVVRAFVQHAADCGIDVFRVFDALNDERNVVTAFDAIRAAGRHIQGAISYSVTERALGGSVFTLDYFVGKARAIAQMGADSLCIKDMAGLLTPDDAAALVTRLKRELSIPVVVHSHFTSGMAYMTLLRAIDAGADVIDTCLAPFALRTSHAAVEPIVAALAGRPRDTGLDLAPKAKEETRGLARDIGDVLCYALYPTTGLRFLRWQHGVEAPPSETRARTLDDIRREQELGA